MSKKLLNRGQPKPLTQRYIPHLFENAEYPCCFVRDYSDRWKFLVQQSQTGPGSCLTRGSTKHEAIMAVDSSIALSICFSARLLTDPYCFRLLISVYQRHSQMQPSFATAAVSRQPAYKMARSPMSVSTGNSLGWIHGEIRRYKKPNTFQRPSCFFHPPYAASISNKFLHPRRKSCRV